MASSEGSQKKTKKEIRQERIERLEHARRVRQEQLREERIRQQQILQEQEEAMAPIKDEDILIILPGSHTTIVQSGITEPKSPPHLFFKTRMFPTGKGDQWEPYKIKERAVVKKVRKHTENKDGEDTAMTGTSEVEYEEVTKMEPYEDRESDEGAVWPIVKGKIVNWPAFCAFINHVYNFIMPTLKSPIVMSLEPLIQDDRMVDLCLFLFEKFKVPAIYLAEHAAFVHTSFDLGDSPPKGHGIIVDVGYEKCDITAVEGLIPVEVGRQLSVPDCGGRALTDNLYRLLGPKGFTYDMCEQLKRSNICEILPVGKPLPTETKAPQATNPAADASTGANAALLGSSDSQSGLQPNPEPGLDAAGDKLEDNEGVLDVASIVASGKASEILAKKEKEKAEKAATKKGKAGAANDPKSMKLSNSEKAKASFSYVEPRIQGSNADPHLGNGDATATAPTFTARDIEVGVERFQAAGPDHKVLRIIADSIYRTVLAAPVQHRSDMWDNIIIVGMGSKVRGFKEALIALLNAVYVVKTMSGTIFASELPSDFSTPVPTGANTPNPHGPNASSSLAHPGVNPLLQAAVHASNPGLAPPGQQQHQQFGGSTRTSYRQTPASAKLAAPRDYLPEWRECGFEQAVFFGAQMVSHNVFESSVDDENKLYMTRSEYNQFGPRYVSKFCTWSNYWKK